MKKLFAWLSGTVIKEIGDAIDKLTTTEEEKLTIKKEVQKILEDADSKAQQQVTDRWKFDMQSDSFLSKNIRPMVLIYLTVIFTALCFTDGNIGEFEISKEYIPIFQTLLVTAYGAYFVGRTWEKSQKGKDK
jgi:tRNA U38,U39,U40 pseudouridine synthase TruA|tara:strand:+ start:15 stop:410 length:396 start_codon:yes stop_codon:yes gene_type:complete